MLHEVLAEVKGHPTQCEIYVAFKYVFFHFWGTPQLGGLKGWLLRENFVLTPKCARNGQNINSHFYLKM